MAPWPNPARSSGEPLGGKRSRVLIVDGDHEVAIHLIRALLEDNQRIDALAALSFETAKQILTELPIDLLICEMQLPGRGDGLELLRWVCRESPSTRTIGMAARRIERLKPEALASGCARFVAKPLDMRKMRRLVGDVLSAKGESFHGSLAQLTPADVIQMLCLGVKTTALRVMNGMQSGVVYIEDGEIVHAQWEELSGEDALYEVLCATEGDFHAIPSPGDAPRTITGGWQHLLLEAMRRQDESTARMNVSDVEDVPTSPDASFDNGWEPPPPPPEGRGSTTGSKGPRAVANLIDEGFDAMRLGDRDTARAKWQAAHEIDPTNRIVDLNLRRLDSMAKRDGAG